MQIYKGKKVAIIGLSIEGLDSAKYFVEEGAVVTCCDRRTKEELGETYHNLAPKNVTFQLGDRYLSNLSRFDMVVRTPGMALDTSQLVEYPGILTSATKLFFENCRASIIGVTGTKGKGTTSSLIAAMLEVSGKTVFLGGNVGTPLLSKLRSITKSDWVVLELSSFQLEDLTKSPHIAVVLPITQDHLANFDPLATNYHKSREDYIDAKSSIVRFQTERDIVIANSDNETSTSLARISRGKKFFVSRKKHSDPLRQSSSEASAFVENHQVFVHWKGQAHKICRSDEVVLRGEHNLENIAASSMAAFLAGASFDAVRKAVKQFNGLPHRLQLVGKVRGISFYDDSFSTVPETTIAAINSFDAPIVLVAGGSEKRSDFTQLGRHIAGGRVKVLIAIGQMTKRIVSAAKSAGFRGELITGARNMHEVVVTASNHASRGDVVLLSPACASFDMFKNYKERGDQFAYEVFLLTHQG